MTASEEWRGCGPIGRTLIRPSCHIHRAGKLGWADARSAYAFADCICGIPPAVDVSLLFFFIYFCLCHLSVLQHQRTEVVGGIIGTPLFNAHCLTGELSRGPDLRAMCSLSWVACTRIICSPEMPQRALLYESNCATRPNRDNFQLCSVTGQVNLRDCSGLLQTPR
jgi:hypothetical protein